MDFFSIILFLALYYVRPQEWIPGAGALQLLRVSVAMAIISLLTRDRGLRWRDFFRTPYDWFMAAYFFWMVFAATDPGRVFGLMYNIFIFYWVTVITLDSIERIQKFLNWWAIFISVMATIALLNEWGILNVNDSYDMTHGMMKDRLTLNLGIFNNPNALGHSIVPAAVMLYFIGVWGRPIFARMLTPLAMAMPIYCIFLTYSKGAFLTGFATLVTALSFKRPKYVQVAILIVSATVGWVAVQNLPRMGELSSSKTDQAIQGRVKAFKFGYEKMQSEFYGLGYPNFHDRFYQRFHFRKSPHSSYVCIGAELGKVGLFMFLSMLYFCFRTLLIAKTTTDAEERVRRILFVLLISYVVSSWMIAWHNRVIYWLMIAACGAFHRLMLDKNKNPVELQPATAEVMSAPLLGFGALQPATVGHGGIVTQITLPPAATTTEVATTTTTDVGIKWNRLRWYDWLNMYLILQAVIWFWHYMMQHM